MANGDSPWPSAQPVLSDGVVCLRGFRAEDTAEVYRACQDPAIQHFTQVPVPYLPEHAAGWVSGNAALWAEARTANFAVTEQEPGRSSLWWESSARITSWVWPASATGRPRGVAIAE